MGTRLVSSQHVWPGRKICPMGTVVLDRGHCTNLVLSWESDSRQGEISREELKVEIKNSIVECLMGELSI